MADALSAPFAAVAIVLCVAGLAKLRSPGAAARFLAALGLPARPWLLRGLAAGEVALGLWGAVAPGRLAAVALVLVYATFAALAAAAWFVRSAVGRWRAGASASARLRSARCTASSAWRWRRSRWPACSGSPTASCG
ncbi:MAG: hypothetical protein ACR2IP_13760 [Solirubrobacteraceae bacterium]